MELFYYLFVCNSYNVYRFYSINIFLVIFHNLSRLYTRPPKPHARMPPKPTAPATLLTRDGDSVSQILGARAVVCGVLQV